MFAAVEERDPQDLQPSPRNHKRWVGDHAEFRRTRIIVCHADIFGVPLKTAALRTDPNGMVPSPITRCIAFIDQVSLHSLI